MRGAEVTNQESLWQARPTLRQANSKAHKSHFKLQAEPKSSLRPIRQVPSKVPSYDSLVSILENLIPRQVTAIQVAGLVSCFHSSPKSSSNSSWSSPTKPMSYVQVKFQVKTIKSQVWLEVSTHLVLKSEVRQVSGKHLVLKFKFRSCTSRGLGQVTLRPSLKSRHAS